MSLSFYIRYQGRKHGPYTEAQISVLLNRGKVNAQTEVSLDGVSWQSLGNFPNFQANVVPQSVPRAASVQIPQQSVPVSRPIAVPLPPAAPPTDAALASVAIPTSGLPGAKSARNNAVFYVLLSFGGMTMCGLLVGTLYFVNPNLFKPPKTKSEQIAEIIAEAQRQAAIEAAAEAEAKLMAAAKEAKEKADARRVAAEKLQAERERKNQELAAERAERERLAAEEKAAADAKVEAERRKKIINDLPDSWGVPGVKASIAKKLENSEQLGKLKEQVTLEFVPLVELAENENFLSIKYDYEKTIQMIKFWREEKRDTGLKGIAATTTKKPVAVINLTDSGLKFEWDSSITNIDEDLKRQYNRILLSKLKIALDGESKEIALLAPVVYKRGLSGACPTLGGEPFKLWQDVPYIVSPGEAATCLGLPKKHEKMTFVCTGKDFLFDMNGVKGYFTLIFDSGLNMKIGFEITKDNTMLIEDLTNKLKQVITARNKQNSAIEEIAKKIAPREEKLTETVKDLKYRDKELQAMSLIKQRQYPQFLQKRQEVEEEVVSIKKEIESLTEQHKLISNAIVQLNEDYKAIEEEIDTLKKDNNAKAVTDQLESVPFSLYLLKSGGNTANYSDQLLIFEVLP
ncbi:MAG: hypothetical protein ACRC2T_18435 [Thermoguttaceae bacterium]